MTNQQQPADAKSKMVLTYDHIDARNGMQGYFTALSGFAMGVMAGAPVDAVLFTPLIFKGESFTVAALADLLDGTFWILLFFLMILTPLAVMLAAFPLYLLRKFRRTGRFVSFKSAMAPGFIYPLGLSLAGWLDVTNYILVFACWIIWLFLYPVFATRWLHRGSSVKE